MLSAEFVSSRGLIACEGLHSAGHNKWEELREPEMLLPFPMWENAMKRMDKDSSRVKKGIVDPGYHVPEPALFLSSLSPEHRKTRSEEVV